MLTKAVLEYNEKGCMLYSLDYIGAFSRAAKKEDAKEKLKEDIVRYCKWANLPLLKEDLEVFVVEDYHSVLEIHNADTGVIFNIEREPLNPIDYQKLKCLVLKSAKDFDELYRSFPKKLFSDLPHKKTFYGRVPRTPKEMYDHTNGVTNYYMGEIQVNIENVANIYENRKLAFERLEKQVDFLDSQVYLGNGKEEWSLPKVLRRFIWHDCIHARAMYRLGCRLYAKEIIKNSFYF